MLLKQPGPLGVATALKPLPHRHGTFAFGETEGSLESVATVTLGENARVGFLSLAKHDPERFNRCQHVDFLRLLGSGATGSAGTCPQSSGG